MIASTRWYPRHGCVASLVTILMLGLAGCGGGDETPAAVPAPSPSPAPGPAPSPGPVPSPGPPPAGQGPTAHDACLAFPAAGGETVRGTLASSAGSPQGSNLRFSLTEQAQAGTVALDAATGDFDYARTSPARGDVDRFVYRVTDSDGRVAEASVEVIYGARRIMPLGDSITEGVESYHPSTGDLPAPAERLGYRKALRDRLVAQGYTVDMVGGTISGGAAGLVDAEHEGHPGYRQTDIRDGVTGWLAANAADVVLLHIGTNDVNAASVTDTSATDEALSRMQAWAADPAHPPLQVQLATIIGQRFGGAALVPAFNADLTAMYRQQWADASDRFVVHLVDMNPALDVSTDLTDPAVDVVGLHPNPDGYDKMAAVWAQALAATGAVRKCP